MQQLQRRSIVFYGDKLLQALYSCPNKMVMHQMQYDQLHFVPQHLKKFEQNLS